MIKSKSIGIFCKLTPESNRTVILKLIEKSFNLGAVEGMSGESKPWVDGRSIEEDKVCLEKLNSLI